MADAVYVVREDAAPETFTWTIPALEAGTIPAGDYAVYARWTSSSANSSSAAYTIAHAPAAGGGTVSDTVTVNQKQNGGQWRLLGTYGFAAGAGHNIKLAAAADGRVVADAVRLVAASGPAADIVYIHPDQLGSPQKLTDAARSVVWDRQAGPFGELETIAGLAPMPLRFPGQYADAETGFSYNYYRDYDPALGRYIQSDPIGLAGGLNTYGYVGGNPLIYADPTGEWLILAPIVAGAVLGASVDIAIQLLFNGGQWDCIDWWSVGVSAGLGAAGGGIGALPSFIKRSGQVFSHWVPSRYLRPLTPKSKKPNPFYKPWLDNAWGRWFFNSRLNGAYVSKRRHFLHDPYYFGNSKAYKQWGEKFAPWLQQLDRIPYWIKGMLGGSMLGPLADGEGASCACR